MGGPKGPERGPTPPATPPPAPAQAPTQNPTEEKSEVKKTTTDKLKEAFGGGKQLEFQLGGAMQAWEQLIRSIFIGIENWDNLKYEQDLPTLQKIIAKWESKIKIPGLKDKDKIKSTTDKPKDDDTPITYLYRNLGIKMPDVKEIQPPATEVKLPHLVMQLKRAGFLYRLGKKSVLEGFKKKPADFHKGDLCVFRNKWTNEFTAGFVVSANDSTMYIRNEQSDQPKKQLTNTCVIAFQLPGNMNNGMVPDNPEEKKKDKKKDEKKKQDEVPGL